MGIRYLLRHLEPFASPVVLGPEASDVVIDGPAFAYYIHNLVYSTKRSILQSRNSLESVPECGELGDGAVAWLERLEAEGLHVYV